MRLPFGWWIGWAWTHCNGESSRTSALVISRHPRDSITWTSAVYVNKRGVQSKSWFAERNGFGNGHGGFAIGTPVGGFRVAWQPRMRRCAS